LADLTSPKHLISLLQAQVKLKGHKSNLSKLI
jgi:hypothetical protein